MKQFESDSLEWWCYLTRQEWQALYMVGFYYRSTGKMPPLDQNRASRFVLTTLVREHEASFDHVYLGSDGELYTDEDEMVEVGNAAELGLILRGIPPDIEVHVGAALEWLEEHTQDFPLDEFRDFKSQVEMVAADAKKYGREGVPDHVKREIREAIEARREAIAGIPPEVN